MLQLSSLLDENLEALNARFGASADFYAKRIELYHCPGAIVLFDNMASLEALWALLLDAATRHTPGLEPERLAHSGAQVYELLMHHSGLPAENSPVKDMEDLVRRLTAGMAVLLLDGCKKGIVFSVQGLKSRSVEEPSGEGNLRGSREGFADLLRVNLSLLRRLIRTDTLVMETAQADCATQCRQAEADCRRKAQLEADRQNKTRQRPALEQAAAEADRSAAAQNAGADALEGQIAERRAALPYPRRADAQAALDKLEADRSALRTGMDTAQRKLKQAEQAVAAAEAAVEALTAQQTAAQKELPARSAEELTAQQTELTAARETLRSREKQLSAQLLPNRKTAAQYRAAAEARQTLESRWQWVSALAATAGGTLTSKQKIKLEAYIQMNYLDRILRYANTRLMQMTAGQYELERIGAENQRSQSGLDLGVIDHYNGTRRSVKTLSGGESFKASLALALGLSDEVQSSAGGIRLDTLFLDEGFGSLDEESLELAIRVLSGLTEGDRLVGIISHVGALKDRIDRQVVVHKNRTGGSTVELVV